MYDISNGASFRTLQNWVKEVKANGPSDIVLGICGNKFDLVLDRQVSYAEAMEYAQSVGAFYMETSARDDKNVSDLFYEVGKRVPASVKSSSESDVDLGLGQQASSSSCC